MNLVPTISMINRVILCDGGSTLQEKGKSNPPTSDLAALGEISPSSRQPSEVGVVLTQVDEEIPRVTVTMKENLDEAGKISKRSNFSELTSGYEYAYKVWELVEGKCSIRARKEFVHMDRMYHSSYSQMEVSSPSCCSDQLIQLSGRNHRASNLRSLSEGDSTGITLRQLRAVTANIERRCIPEGWTDIEGNHLRPETVTLYDVNKYVIKPFTAESQKSFVDMLPSTSFHQAPRFYADHLWGETVKDFVLCLEQYLSNFVREQKGQLDENLHSANREGIEDIPVWISAYSINQWDRHVDRGELEMERAEQIHLLRQENIELREKLQDETRAREDESTRNASLAKELETLRKSKVQEPSHEAITNASVKAIANASMDVIKKSHGIEEQYLEQMTAMVNEVKTLCASNEQLRCAYAKSEEVHKQVIQEAAKVASLQEQLKQHDLMYNKEKSAMLHKHEVELQELRKSLTDSFKGEIDGMRQQVTQDNAARKRAEEERNKAVVAYEEALKRTLAAEAHLEKMSAMIEEAKVFVASKEKLYHTLNMEIDKRKELHNKLEDIKGRIRVFVRVRPMLASENANEFEESLVKEDSRTCVMYREDERGSFTKSWEFDQIFSGTGEDNSQADVFKDTKNLITSAVDGYNVCIFAYGQTGGGKVRFFKRTFLNNKKMAFSNLHISSLSSQQTYTLFGPPGETDQFDTIHSKAGLAPRAAVELFKLLEEKKESFEVSVKVNMFEVYNDSVRDLLISPKALAEGKQPPLRIKLAEHSESGLVEVEGSISEEVKDAKGLLHIFKRGAETRSTATTRMNADSSRSHLVTSIVTRLINKRTGRETCGKLTICDLAGSERVRKRYVFLFIHYVLILPSPTLPY